MLDPYWPRFLAACKRQDLLLLPAMQGARQLGVQIIPNGDGGLKFGRGDLSQQAWDEKFVPLVKPKLETHIRPALILAAQMPHPWLPELQKTYTDLSERRQKGIDMLSKEPARQDVAQRLAEVIYHLLVIGGIALDVVSDAVLAKEIRLLYRNLDMLATRYPIIADCAWMTPAPAVIEGAQVRVVQGEAQADQISADWLRWAMLTPADQLQDESMPLRKGA